MKFAAVYQKGATSCFAYFLTNDAVERAGWELGNIT